MSAGPAVSPRGSVAIRLVSLVIGLCIFGLGIALMARAQLGLGPWSALHEGLGRQIGVPMGTVEILLSIPILLAWIPLRERPGIGTVVSTVVLGLATNAGLALIPVATRGLPQVAFMATGTVLVGAGSAMYLAAELGPGPRDGLMTGLQRRFGWPIAPVRTAIEVSVLVLGVILGGTIGPGTVAYAITIGPVLAVLLRWAGATRVLRPPPRP
jgi:uncharacterized membrane protein YczE